MALRKRAREAADEDAPAGAPSGAAAAGGPAWADDGSEDEATESDTEEEEVVLPGADDPSFVEQYALWRERRFIDVWLQARCGALRGPGVVRGTRRFAPGLPATRRAPTARLPRAAR